MIAALAHLPRAARLRVVLDTLAIGAPAVLAGGVAAWRLTGPLGTLAVGAAGASAFCASAFSATGSSRSWSACTLTSVPDHTSWVSASAATCGRTICGVICSTISVFL